MKALSIIDRYVFFANFEKIVTEDIPTLVKLYDGAKMTQRQEPTPQGPITVTSFALKNTAITFRKNRMDIEFANNPTLPESSLDFAVEQFAKLKQTYPDLAGNRISYIGTSFIPNQQNEPLMDLVDNLGLSAAFGESTEFNFRLNSPVVISREKCNAVLTVQPGNVQNQKKQNIPAIICINDINTLATDTTNRFELDDLKEIFTGMLNKAVEKNEKVLALIEDATIAS